MKQLLAQPLALARSAATKKVIKQFAQKFELVYFGFVDPREDEHELVRGITLSTRHRDTHYTVGGFRHHDLTLVERQVTLTFPGKPDKEYTWLIMQIDLRHAHLPHVFFDAHHHDEVFYANFFLKYAHFEDATGLFARHDAAFARAYKVFAERTTFDEVWSAVKPELTAMVAHHFRQFDYELHGDKLFIYASNAVVTMHLLQEMLRVGAWLADHLDSQPTIS